AHSNSSILIPKTRIDSILLANVVTPEHAAEFGKLVIQDAGGRMKPVNTYASELLRKLSKSDNYEGFTPDQVIISITENPTLWYNVPIINVKRGNDSIRHVAGVSEDEKFLPLTSFFEADGSYKLSKYL